MDPAPFIKMENLEPFKAEEHMGLHCEFCSKSFTSKAVMLEHRRIHTGERPYGCTICNKRFTQKAHLIIHKRTHTGEKPYPCHICHKRFAQSSHLTTHKRIHTGEKPYFCPICKAGYSRKQRLEVHILQHAQEGTLTPGMSIEQLTQLAELSPLDNTLPSTVNLQAQRGTGSASSSQSPASSTSSSLHRRKPTVVKKLVQGEGDVDDFSNMDNLMDESFMSEVKVEPEEDDKEEEVNERSFPSEEENVTTGDASSSFEHDRSVISSKDMSGTCVLNSSDMQHAVSGDEGDACSVTSDSNQSSSEQSISTANRNTSLLARSSYTSGRLAQHPSPRITGLRYIPKSNELPSPRSNSRICLVDFTSADLITHLMSRDDAYKCDFCCIVFQDAAMYHLHRSMHEKMDIRCCNLCGKMAQDKYDFTAHFLNEHK